MDPAMEFNGPLHGHNVVAGMAVSGGTANINFHSHAANPPPFPLHVIPFPRNEGFVNRNDIFSKIERLLRVPDSQNIALWGLGGAGKTQIALEIAYRQARKQPISIFWVHADSEVSFAQDYKLIAQRAGLPDALTGEELLAAVRDCIARQPHWLLVLDNADNLKMFGIGDQLGQSSVSSYRRFVPQGPSGMILFTSRDERIVGTLVGPQSAIEVSSMRLGEAEALFTTVMGRSLGDEELDDAKKLLSKLHHLPLAVSQAAAYIRRTKTSVSKYLRILSRESNRWTLLKNTEFDRHRREGVSNCFLETWNISFAHLKEEDETAIRILNVIAYLDHQKIPIEIIKAAVEVQAGEQGEDLQTSTEDRSNECSNTDNVDPDDYNSDDLLSNPDDPHIDDSDADDADFDSSAPDNSIRRALRRLHELSFLHKRTPLNGLVYVMHPLVQEATRHHHRTCQDAENQSYFAQTALRTLLRVLPDLNPKRKTWDGCEQYFLHMVRAWYFIKEGGIRVPELKKAAKLFCELSDLEKSVQKRGTDLVQAAIGCMCQQKYDEAERLYLEAIDEQQKIRSRIADGVLYCKELLGLTYLFDGKYIQARKSFLQVSIARKKILGADHSETIDSMGKLALAYIGQGQNGKVERLLLAVLSIQKRVFRLKGVAVKRKIFGEDLTDVLDNMETLTRIYCEPRQYDVAENVCLRLLAKQKKRFGKSHIGTSSIMGIVAKIHYDQENYSEAEKSFTEAIRLRRNLPGDQRLDLLLAMTDLGLAYVRQDKLGEAEGIAMEAMELQREVKNEFATNLCMGLLMMVYILQGKFEEGRRMEAEIPVLQDNNGFASREATR